MALSPPSVLHGAGSLDVLPATLFVVPFTRVNVPVPGAAVVTLVVRAVLSSKPHRYVAAAGPPTVNCADPAVTLAPVVSLTVPRTESVYVSSGRAAAVVSVT